MTNIKGQKNKNKNKKATDTYCKILYNIRKKKNAKN